MATMVATVMTMVPLVVEFEPFHFWRKRLGKRNLYSVSAGLQLTRSGRGSLSEL